MATKAKKAPKIATDLNTRTRQRRRAEIQAYGFERYEGAIPSTARPWAWMPPRDAHLDIRKATRQTLVERSRELEKNNPYWAKFLDIHESYTVGRGISVTPSSSDPKFNAYMAEAFADWCREPLVDSNMSLAEAERTFARAGACDGEAFILKIQDRGQRKLQIVECQRVDTPNLGNNFQNIRDGIRYTEEGRPISYFIRTKTDAFFGNYREYPAWQVIHIFNPSRFGQERGIPLCSNVINDLIDLDILHKYEMAAAKVNSEKAAVWTRQGDGIDDGEASPWGDATETETAEERRVNIEEAWGGTVIGINPGESLNPYISQRPSVVTQEYWEFLLKKISAGIGYSDLLIFPRSVQGTIVRANLETTAARLRAEHEIYAAAVKEIYKFFAESQSYRTRVSDWWKCTTQPPRSPIVDIERNTKAILEETRNGMRSLTYNCAELGRSIEDVLREKALECKLIKKTAEEAEISTQELLSSMTGIFSGNLPKEAFQKQKEEEKNEG